MARLVHRAGELAAAAAAGTAGTVFCVSTASSCTIEEIAEAARGPLWFQIYLWRREEVVKSLVERVLRAGYRALVVTVDVPIVGNRERDIRNGVALPPRIRPTTVLDVCRRPRWLSGFLRGPTITLSNLQEVTGSDRPGAIAQFADRELNDPSATWERLSWLRRLWPGPLVVKGVLSQRDALEAVGRGADAVYVSNHGGRQLDSSPATLDVLRGIVEVVGDRAEVLVDGGVRRGDDAVKACALGARACLVGRPWIMALGAGGEPAIARLLELIRADVDRTLALVGVPQIDQVGPEVLLEVDDAAR
jgi:L-lactate dehydrogenase (cytochrome)